jgi:hypothetical protein
MSPLHPDRIERACRNINDATDVHARLKTETAGIAAGRV